jgi:hypothetical protein
MVSRLSAKCFAIALCALLGGCSLLGSKRVDLRTVPAGAEVSLLDGEKLGVTPLVLKGDLIEKASTNGRLELLVSRGGYQTRQLVLDVHGNDRHDVRLTALDQDYFARKALQEFAQPINAMARQLLRIQGLLLVKKLDEAQKLIEEFQKDYPNVASSFVLLANVELLKGRPQKARGYLLRAQSIDSRDPVISRMLGSLPQTKGK